jgi:nucleotide-binding universal stress UspA family protein
VAYSRALRRLLLGSVVAGVVRRARCSVMGVCVKPNGGSGF